MLKNFNWVKNKKGFSRHIALTGAVLLGLVIAFIFAAIGELSYLFFMTLPRLLEVGIAEWVYESYSNKYPVFVIFTFIIWAMFLLNLSAELGKKGSTND